MNKKCKNCEKLIPNRNTYCNNKCQSDYQTKLKIDKFRRGEYKDTNLIYSQGRWNQRLLVEEFGYFCNKCGISEWNGTDIVLEVNHIDGKAYNNVLENLEFLCPNCHSQTDTYKNKGSRSSDRTYRKN